MTILCRSAEVARLSHPAITWCYFFIARWIRKYSENFHACWRCTQLDIPCLISRRRQRHQQNILTRTCLPEGNLSCLHAEKSKMVWRLLPLIALFISTYFIPCTYLYLLESTYIFIMTKEGSGDWLLMAIYYFSWEICVDHKNICETEKIVYCHVINTSHSNLYSQQLFQMNKIVINRVFIVL